MNVSHQSALTQNLPLVTEDVTAAWLTSALAQRYPGVKVTSARQETILQGTATKIRVRASHRALLSRPLITILSGAWRSEGNQ